MGALPYPLRPEEFIRAPYTQGRSLPRRGGRDRRPRRPVCSTGRRGEGVRHRSHARPGHQVLRRAREQGGQAVPRRPQGGRQDGRRRDGRDGLVPGRPVVHRHRRARADHERHGEAPGQGRGGEAGAGHRGVQRSRPRLLAVLRGGRRHQRGVRRLGRRPGQGHRQPQDRGHPGARRAGPLPRLLRRHSRTADRPARGDQRRGEPAGTAARHGRLPGRRPQLLAARRHHVQAADRRRGGPGAGLLPQRLQLPDRQQSGPLWHPGLQVRLVPAEHRGRPTGRLPGPVVAGCGRRRVVRLARARRRRADPLRDRQQPQRPGPVDADRLLPGRPGVVQPARPRPRRAPHHRHRHPVARRLPVGEGAR
ncbi:hypothetical protein SGPA1_40160 [Streptomyces misionensis JCM 4497]